jgi:16S rRNA (guanine527-N7)-methyltransferase
MISDTFLQHQFELSDTEIALFEKFLHLFTTYNAHTNLSAIRDEVGIVEKHFIDSLHGANIISEIFPDIYTQNIRLLDIGSGGGFPGIPLGIVYPDMAITLLDSVGKKVKAMNHFVDELHLNNDIKTKRIYAIQERAEILGKDYTYRGGYDIVTSRATAYVTDMLFWATPFLLSGGYILLYKTPSIEEAKDMKSAAKKYHLSLEKIYRYTLCGQERQIYIFRKN